MLKRKYSNNYPLYRKPTYQPYSKPELTKMRQLAKQVVIGSAETKTWCNQNTSNIVDNGGVYVNLTNGVVVGTGQVNRIGKKIRPVRIDVRCLFYSNPASGTATKTFRVMLIKTNIRLGTTSGTLTLNDIFKPSTQSVVMDSLPDLNKVTVYHDRTYTTTPTYGSVTAQTMLRPIQFSVYPKSPDHYEEDTSSYLKNGSYYLIFTAYDGNVTVTPGGFNYAWNFQFKDE